MSKLLRVGDYILLSAAIVGEISEDIRLVGDLMPKIMETKYGFVPSNYKRASYLSTVSKMLSVGNIERKTDQKGNFYFELTSKGNKSFKRKFPILSLQKKKWDGQFMVVIFDIEEKKRKDRDSLRNKLRELGFGKLQESVWVSPHHFEEDLREFLEEAGFQESVFVLTAKTLGVGNYQEILEKIWSLNEINDGYAGILKRINSKKPNLKKIWEDYFAIAAKDPMLPNELLPKDWCREEVLIKINNLALTNSSRS